MPDIDDHIRTYLVACAVEGKSDNTIASYVASLRDFRRGGGTLGLPDDIAAYTIPHVYSFLSDVRSRGTTPAYQHRRHREVKAFFSWCKRMGLVDENVFARVPLVKLEQQIVQPFNHDQVQAILGSQDQSTSSSRNYALFLLDSGVRASECVAVRLDDVDWDQCRVRVLHGKGKKQRWVGIGERTIDALRHYIDDYRGTADAALFLTHEGQPLANGHALNVILQRVAARTGLTKVHPHRFRHTFATWAIRAHAREIDVQSLLGHSSLTMVQRYARTYSSEEAVQAHAAFSPVGQLATPDAGASHRLPAAVGPSGFASGTSRVSHAPSGAARRDDMPIEDRRLEPGMRLVATYKGRTYACTVGNDTDKPTFALNDGRRFKSPSAAGSAVMGGIACNGWRFWSVESAVGDPAAATDELTSS